MSEQNIEYERTKIQNQILDLEEKYMHIIEEIVTSPEAVSFEGTKNILDQMNK